jgi:hypothetical protein
MMRSGSSLSARSLISKEGATGASIIDHRHLLDLASAVPPRARSSAPHVGTVDPHRAPPQPARALRRHRPARPFPSSILRDKNRRVTQVNLTQYGPIPRWKRPAHHRRLLTRRRQ